jgi:hypothetical protein
MAGEHASGLSLSQYAAITAALAEPHPLADVLAAEGVSEPAWKDADLAWTERLTRDPSLFVGYRRELAAAEDRMARKITPLDAEIAAWTAFLATLGASAEPTTLLASLDLGMNDLKRLQRRWAARLEEDEALRRRAAELQKNGAGPLPRVVTAPRVLARSGAAGPADASRAKETPRAKESLQAKEARESAPDRAPEGVPAVAIAVPTFLSGTPAPSAPSYLMAGEARPLAPAPSPAAFVSPPTPPAIQTETADLGALFAAGAPLPFEKPSIEPASPEIPGSGTVALDALLPREALPFREGAQGVDASRAKSESAPAAPELPKGETMDVGALFRAREAVPFGGPKPAAEPSSSGETVDVGALFRAREPVPFGGPKSGSAAEPAAAKAPELPDLDVPDLDVPAAKKEAAALVGTAETVDVRQVLGASMSAPSSATVDIGTAFAAKAPVTPFSAAPAPPEQAYASAVAHAAATQKEAPPKVGGETLDVGAIFRAGLLAAKPAPAPAAPVAPAPAAPAPAAPAVSAPVSAVPASPAAVPAASPPTLTLQQYASLCVELHRDPARTAETLARYRLSPAQWTSIDAAQRARLSTDPAAYAEFWRAYELYRAFLESKR